MTGRGGALKPLRRPRLWTGLWCAAIAAVVAVSLAPPPPMPPVEGGDKLGHLLAYGTLSACAVQLFARWRALAVAAAGLALLGAGLEFAQGALTATRTADPLDALANALGVAAGLATRLTPWRDLLLRLDARL